jgi:hypothetical protein
MSITHPFVSAIPDGADATVVQPSDWNDAHTIGNDTISYAQLQNVSATDNVLGRSTAGSGDVEEIPCTAAGRALLDDANAAAQLVTLGAQASIGYTPANKAGDTFTGTVLFSADNTFDIGATAGTRPSAVYSPRHLTGTGVTLTTSAPILDLAQTWNASGVTFTGLKANITDTASAAASLLIDLQVGGTSKCKVSKDGTLTVTNTVSAAGNGIFQSGTLTPYISNVAGTAVLQLNDAAQTLAQRNAANAQTFCIYRSWTDASNYSRLAINDNQIKSEVLGTGTLTETVSRPILDLAQTWNDAAVTFTGIKANFTDTASATSLLIDLQVGGTSKCKVSKDGTLTVTNTVSAVGNGIFQSGTLTPNISNVAGTAVLQLNDAAQTLAQRNAANAQTFRVYGTWTDASNYERLSLSHVTGTGSVIAAETAGTGGDDLSIKLTPAGTGNVMVSPATAAPAGGSTAARLLFGTTAGFGVYYGSGAPSVSAAKGSLYLRSDGSGAADRAYINTDGGTTWTAIATVG